MRKNTPDTTVSLLGRRTSVIKDRLFETLGYAMRTLDKSDRDYKVLGWKLKWCFGVRYKALAVTVLVDGDALPINVYILKDDPMWSLADVRHEVYEAFCERERELASTARASEEAVATFKELCRIGMPDNVAMDVVMRIGVLDEWTLRDFVRLLQVSAEDYSGVGFDATIASIARQ